QGQLTCDINKLDPQNTMFERSLLGAYCNAQGRMIAAFSCFIHHDIYYLRMPRAIIEKTLKSLRHFAMFSKVTLRDASDDFSLFTLCSEKIPDVEMENILIKLPSANFLSEMIIPKSYQSALSEILNSHLKNLDPDYWKL